MQLQLSSVNNRNQHTCQPTFFAKLSTTTKPFLQNNQPHETILLNQAILEHHPIKHKWLVQRKNQVN
jgi:hypothetical protein